MRNKLAIIPFVLIIFLQSALVKAQDSVVLFVNGIRPTLTISKHIYGHFSEHLGSCIYDGFWVSDTSTLPGKDRISLDVVEALKKIKIPNLRWPGSCFADEYHWSSY